MLQNQGISLHVCQLQGCKCVELLNPQCVSSNRMQKRLPAGQQS